MPGSCYMGTEHSSEETRSRARNLAEEVGTTHVQSVIDPLLHAMAVRAQTEQWLAPWRS